jgi:hypothetical protein
MIRWLAMRVLWHTWFMSIGVAGLSALALGYWLTYEPAPAVRVQWREGLTPQQHEALERKYLLVNGRDQIPGGSIAYDLLDTSARNLRALVRDAAVADTGDIDRDTFTIPFDTEYGQSWMWIAYRIPGLRQEEMRRVVTVLLVIMAISGLGARLVRHRGKLRVTKQSS